MFHKTDLRSVTEKEYSSKMDIEYDIDYHSAYIEEVERNKVLMAEIEKLKKENMEIRTELSEAYEAMTEQSEELMKYENQIAKTTERKMIQTTLC
jgi:peptidoglycan hydrolase CwlO-like protein